MLISFQQQLFNINIWDKWKCIFFLSYIIVCFFGVCVYLHSLMQWENHKSISVWFGFVYKTTESNCCLQLFANFIKTQLRYPSSLGKISILTWKLLIISSQNLPFELNSSRTYSTWYISYFHQLPLQL